MVAPLAVNAVAAPVPTPDRIGSLVAVGPISGDHGFPVWYQDSTTRGGKPLRLEACLDPKDVVCPIPAGTLPDPDAPVDLGTGNFPDEFFYQLAGSELDLPGGGTAVLTLGLEGAFANGNPTVGDQIVFARTRYVLRDAQPGATYTFRQPWGVDTVTAEADGRGKFVEDIGLNPGVFTTALNGRIGPFLRWSSEGPQPPAGYVGVPGIPHAITGSGIKDEHGQYQNYFRVIGPDGSEARNDLFDIQGRVAQNAGVEAQQAVYSTSRDGDTSVEVFATSDPGASVQVRDTGTTRRFARTVLTGDSAGRYYGHLAATGKPGAIDVVNVGDNPVTTKSLEVVDRVTVTRAAFAYDAAHNTGHLDVTAYSSDEAGRPALTVTGFGQLGDDGSREFAGVVAPPTITVTSGAGGSVTVPVATSGDRMAPVRPTASAGAGQLAQPGQEVMLDASLSDGDITSYAWEQLTDGDAPQVTLSSPSAVYPRFTAPAEPGDLRFQVTVTGAGGTSTAQVTVTVESIQQPELAVAQTAIAAQRGTTVTLDASASKGISTFAWTRVSGPGITLKGADTAKPTVVVPLRRLPGQGVVANTATVLTPIVMRLDASGPGGNAEPVTVTITPQTDTPVIASAEFRAKTREWRIQGSSSVLAGQRVAVVLGSTTGGAFLGFADVDATGAWVYRGIAAAAPATSISTVSVVSSLGGQRLGFGLRRK
jgi:hypothetical protein